MNFLSAFLFGSFIASISCQCPSYPYYIISQSQTPETVLEASENKVILSYFTGALTQGWIFGCADTGFFYIQNQATGFVFDVDPQGPNGDQDVVLTLNVFSQSQRWYIDYDGHIVNAYYKKAIDISNILMGGTAKMVSVASNNEQLFVLQKRV